jgi:hypothetical protein
MEKDFEVNNNTVELVKYIETRDHANNYTEWDFMVVGIFKYGRLEFNFEFRDFRKNENGNGGSHKIIGFVCKDKVIRDPELSGYGERGLEEIEELFDNNYSMHDYIDMEPK